MGSEQLVQFGAMGIVLAWFMFRNEKKTEGLTKAINNQTKVMIYLVDVISGCPNNSSGTNGNKLRASEFNKIKEEVLRES
jgi:hypothetical protein